MITLPRISRTLLPTLAATLALVAVAAPAASAETRLSVWLNEQTGVLSITGTEVNDYAAVTKQVSASPAGGYVLRLNVKNSLAADFSDNCTEGGGLGDWVITCPALNVNKITFDGKGLHDSFINDTSVPSEAHGGPGIDDFKGGSGADRFYGDGDGDYLYGNFGDDTLDGGGGYDRLSRRLRHGHRELGRRNRPGHRLARRRAERRRRGRERDHPSRRRGHPGRLL